MKRNIFVLLVVLACCALLVSGCSDDDDDDNDDATLDDDDTTDDDTADDDVDDDDNDDDDIGDLPQWLTDRPYLQDRSPWRQDIDMSDAPLVRKLGVQAVGNGKVFGLLGNQYPLGTWHNIGGPNYQKDLKWFTDKEPWIFIPQGRVQPTFQSISRVTDTAVMVITANNGLLEWTSVNFAPKYAADPLAEQALISVWIVRNIGEQMVPAVTFVFDSNLGDLRGGTFHENSFEGHFLDARPLELTGIPGSDLNDMWVPLGDMEPGDEIVFTLPMAFTERGTTANEVFAAIEGATVDTLLESTVQWWQDWFAQMTVVDTPDDKFDDLLRMFALSIKVSQAESGGLCEMSEYSNTWLRDTMGPAVYLPLIGFADDFKDMLDYHWGATLINGNLANALAADFDISNLPPEPDWENLPVMTGRTRAEGPSYVPLQYEQLYRATGNLDLIEQRYGMLKHALVHQQFVDGCMLYFSSDETFEDLMEVSFGLNFIPEPETEFLSANSSYLLIAAARFMADVAQRLGYAADATMFTQMADDVAQCLDDTFWIDSQDMYAVMVDTITREPWPMPYEDISTQAIWLKALPLDDPRVIDTFETLMDILGRENGTAVSKIAFPYTILFPQFHDGVQTGMSHGYYLMNLTRMFHPMADVAFTRWADVVTAAGGTDEAVLTEDYGHLSLLREPFGIVCDVSARYRSWESGIMGQAFLYYLTGFEYHIVDGYVDLAPHLPPDWDQVNIAGLPFGDGRFDLTVTDNEGGGRLVRLTTDADSAFTLNLVVPIDGEVASVTVDGTAGDYETEVNAYGRTVVTLDPLDIAADNEYEIIVNLAK